MGKVRPALDVWAEAVRVNGAATNRQNSVVASTSMAKRVIIACPQGTGSAKPTRPWGRVAVGVRIRRAA